jgi:protein-disulfide isomerase
MEMLNYRRLFLLLALIATLVLVACRPAADLGSNASAASETRAPAAAAVGKATEPAATGESATPAPVATRPVSDGQFPNPSEVEESLATIPTPPPDAIVPTPASFRLEEMTDRGPADAAVTIVEFSDYQCPYCLRYFDETYRQIIDNYVEAGYVRYVFKDFPLEQLHPQAKEAAEAARCAGDQNAYWAMHDQLFGAQESWAGQEDPTPIFVGLAQDLGLDDGALQECLDSGRYTQAVAADLAEGQALGVTGTPTFFINGYPLVGARAYEIFQLAFGLADAGRLSDAFAQAPTPTPIPIGEIPTEGAPSKGDQDAPVLMIEYSDYQCPYCSRYVQETLPLIEENYIQTGKVRYVFKDFPLSFHAQANLAAQAARCAGDQGDYWGMHDLLFANQQDWANDGAAQTFSGYAGQLGLDTSRFDSCLASGVYADAIKNETQEGLSVGVSGTPAFFVNGQFISGAQPYQAFQQAIEAALNN